MITPGAAYWNQRFAIQQSAERLLNFSRLVDHPGDFTPYQFAQLFGLALEFAPDLILELGGGFGNSTCAFTEAANRLGNGCKVVSISNCGSWQDITAPRLQSFVGDDWFRPLDAAKADILTFDFDSILAPAKRALIFWDAHGFDVAECVLGKVMRAVSSKEHIVALHDVLDLRYSGPLEAGDYVMWKGSDAAESRYCINGICSNVSQLISVVDFTWRNKLTLESADHSIHTTIGVDEGKVAEMAERLGDLFSLNAYWYWFTMNEHPGPYKFPVVPQVAPR